MNIPTFSTLEEFIAIILIFIGGIILGWGLNKVFAVYTEGEKE